MFFYMLFLVVGMVLLIKGADLFVDGSSGIAKKFGIPSLIIGLTLVLGILGSVLGVLV